MDLMQTAAQLFLSKMGQQGEGLDLSSVMSALGQLLPVNGGQLDISALMGAFSKSGNLQNMLSSWLGDGANSAMAPSQIVDILGVDKVTEFASSLGMPTDTAAGGLAAMIPELIDRNSEGGNLIEGDLGKSLLGKFGL